MTTQFKLGHTYSTRSACDHNCIFSFVILARTAKSVTVDVHGTTVRRGLSIYNGVEQFKPFGSYSMAAIITAEDRPAPTTEITDAGDFYIDHNGNVIELHGPVISTPP